MRLAKVPEKVGQKQITDYYVEFPTKIFLDSCRRKVPWFSVLRDLETVKKIMSSHSFEASYEKP